MTRDPKALMLSLNLSLNNKSADSIKATCACYLVGLALFLNGGISRQTASGLRKTSAVLLKEEAPLAGLPLFKNSPPDCF